MFSLKHTSQKGYVTLVAVLEPQFWKSSTPTKLLATHMMPEGQQ